MSDVTLDAETERALYNLCSMAAANGTLTRRQLRALLLSSGGWITCRGHIRDIRSKQLGAGVYRVWTEARP